MSQMPNRQGTVIRLDAQAHSQSSEVGAGVFFKKKWTLYEEKWTFWIQTSVLSICHALAIMCKG